MKPLTFRFETFFLSVALVLCSDNRRTISTILRHIQRFFWKLLALQGLLFFLSYWVFDRHVRQDSRFLPFPSNCFPCSRFRKWLQLLCNIVVQVMHDDDTCCLGCSTGVDDWLAAAGIDLAGETGWLLAPDDSGWLKTCWVWSIKPDAAGCGLIICEEAGSMIGATGVGWSVIDAAKNSSSVNISRLNGSILKPKSPTQCLTL